ncbi:hypothetical protein BDN72DRAFT_879324 [Pluteus cervinus]|uniref:Uncharacterized protein n=1 Tax=Pluteus cervinus TaxID=181527 RepID=A0ACD3AQD9_9AGAR|nr:hypothetical protein BDN72DRAFT_879324 [Pluteus cervinus]
MDVDLPASPADANVSPGRRLLDVDAIVRRIVRETTYPGLFGTYARMAQTCKSLFLPSITRLWSYGGSLQYLFTTLPSDCWERDSPPEEKFHVSIKLLRKLKPEDLQRMRIYAQYITSLPYGLQISTVKAEVLSAVISVHAEAFGTPNFLPNLSTLLWNTELDSDFPFIMVFLNARLRHLSVFMSNSPKTRLSFLAHVSALCPHLSHISLHGGDHSETIATGSSLLVGWEYLHSLSIKCVSTEVMMYLMQMRRLSDLTLEHVDNIDWGAVKTYTSSLDNPTFPALGRLGLTQAKFTPCIEMLREVNLSTLANVIFGFKEPLNRDMWTLLFNTLQNRCPTGLTSITVRDTAVPDASDVQTQANEELTLNEICLLFPFKDITNLSLLASCDFGLDDSGIESIAKAFPKLKDFSLETRGKPPSDPAAHPVLDRVPPKCTLASLYKLSIHCPNLSWVHLSFDARTIPPIPAETIAGAQPSEMFGLDVAGYSPLEDPDAVTQYLKTIFPKLACVAIIKSDSDGPDSLLARKWKEVRDKVMKKPEDGGEKVQEAMSEVEPTMDMDLDNQSN